MQKPYTKPSGWLIIALLAAAAPIAHSADEGLAMEHYRVVTEIREGQWPVWQNEEATAEDLEASLARLGEGLDYLGRPEVQALALGNIYLYYRSYNIRRDMVQIAARLERPEQVAEQLRHLRHYVVNSGGHASTMELLPKAARDHPAVKKELAAWQALDRLATAEALATPFAENLSQPEKLAGLSRIWAMAREYFVHFDGAPELDWDKAYLDTIETVLGTESTADYYRELMRFMALLADSHSNVYPPEALHGDFYSRPPIRTQLLEGRVIVTDVLSARLRASGVSVGSEIVSIDGMPVREYAREHVAPFQSASTRQDLMVRKYSYALLAGAADRSVRLELVRADGSSDTLVVERSGYDDVKWPESFRRRQFDGGIEYLSLDSFADNRALEVFEAAWPELRQANGLILDVRDNGGGSSWPGYRVLAHLINQPFVPGAVWSRRNDSIFQAGSASVEFHPLVVDSIKPIDGERYAGPVVLLISARTFSAAEDMAMAFAISKRGVIIGETTAGSTGQPLLFNLPGGGRARICAKRDSWPDGSPLVGVGVPPDIEVRPSVEDIRAARDAALDAALGWIRERQ